jgi:hypothetical protein
MFNVHRSSVMALLMFCVGIPLPVRAEAFELTGVWATHADLCNLVFTKKDNQAVFTELSDLYGSGFIVDGSRIKLKAAHCSIQSKKQDGNSLELSAACATSIMTSSARFNLTIIDDNNISRLIPEVPGMTLSYTRCSL